jgi:hypothetical protein
VLGISEYRRFDPIDTAHLKELELSGEEVGDLLTNDKEFPYDWGYGELAYITFLSAIFSGTIVLEGTYERTKLRIMDGWMDPHVVFETDFDDRISNRIFVWFFYRCDNFDYGAGHAFGAQRFFSQRWIVRNFDWYPRAGVFGFDDYVFCVSRYPYLYRFRQCNVSTSACDGYGLFTHCL